VPLYAWAALGVALVIGLFTYLPTAPPETAHPLTMVSPPLLSGEARDLAPQSATGQLDPRGPPSCSSCCPR
jgi:hypothetical protein